MANNENKDTKLIKILFINLTMSSNNKTIDLWMSLYIKIWREKNNLTIVYDKKMMILSLLLPNKLKVALFFWK